MKALLISVNYEVGVEIPLPLGLACVAAATEKAGHGVLLLAATSATGWESAIRERIGEFRPDVIGISVRNIDDQNMQAPHFFLELLRKVVSVCRSASRATVVLGGAGYSVFPESALMYLGADMGIQGEGEVVFPALLSWVEHGAQEDAPRSLHLPGRSPTGRGFAQNLDALPMPEPRLWLYPDNNPSVRIPVQSRRGCPLDCIYCSTSAIEGRPVRQRSPELVVRWLAELRKCGFRNFYFVDNTFNLPLSYAKELCRKMIQADLGIDWWSIVCPKWVDIELVELMTKAGCTQVSLGFESGSEPMLRQLKKEFNTVEAKVISELFADVGIKRHGFLLLLRIA